MIRSAEGRRPGLRAKHSVKRCSQSTHHVAGTRFFPVLPLAVLSTCVCVANLRNFNIQARRFWEDRSAGSLSKS